MEDHKIFLAKIDELPEMLSWIRKKAKSKDFAFDDIKKIEIAMEEVIINIIHHAYKNISGRIHLSVLFFSNRIEITVKDKGPPFNPLEVKKEKKSFNVLEETKEGGMGIFIFRHCMDDFSYRRWESYNILTMIKYKKKQDSRSL